MSSKMILRLFSPYSSMENFRRYEIQRGTLKPLIYPEKKDYEPKMNPNQHLIDVMT